MYDEENPTHLWSKPAITCDVDINDDWWFAHFISKRTILLNPLLYAFCIKVLPNRIEFLD